MKKYFTIGFFTVSMLFSLKIFTTTLIGTWKHTGFACGTNYRPVPNLKRSLKAKRKIFRADNTYITKGKIPGKKGLPTCNITANGSYTVTKSIINTKIVSSNVDCDKNNNFPISMSKLLKEVILPKNKEKNISQKFHLVGNTLYFQLSTHTPPRQYPLLPPSPKGKSTVSFQVPANTLKPPSSCKKDEKVYEVFSRVK